MVGKRRLRHQKSILNYLILLSLVVLFVGSDYIRAGDKDSDSSKIIEITNAEHLNASKNVIENVYAEVSKEDGIFTAIESEEYLRVTFSENLTKSRDITIYAQGTPGSSVEVYEKGGDRLIARFDDINSFSKYQIFLTNLTSYSQNTFDLKSKGIVFYDYIVDPNETSDTTNSSEYWMLQRYLNHTSWDGVDFPIISTLSNASYTTARAITSPVSVANGFVYVSGNYDNSAIFQLNASNITQLVSSFSTGGGTNPLSPITIGGGYVYASGGLTNVVHQLNASNISQQIANFTADGVSSYFMALANGSLYVTTESNSLYQLNASNISQMIANTTGTRGSAYANGFIYTNDGSDHLVQLNASNISQILSTSTAVQYIGNPTIWNGYVYTSAYYNYIYQFNASDLSQIISSYNLGSYYFYTAPAIAGGYLYTGLNNNTILQLNASNVSQAIAAYTTGGGIFSSPAVANGYVYVGSNDNYTYQLNASNISQLIASYPTGNGINSAPAVANGYVYIGSDDTNIYQLCASNVSVTDGTCSFANEPWSGEYPQFSNYWDDTESLLDSGTGHFNVTIENTNGTVYLNIDGQNVFAQNLSLNVYNVSYTFSSSGDFPYTWYAYGNSTNHNLGSSDLRSYTVNTSADTTYPQFSNYWDDNGTLSDSGVGHFNVTVTDTNGTVLLEINNQNITATNLTFNVYNVSYSFSSSGAYSYRWYSWGNGTDHLAGSSSSRSYTVNTTYTPSNLTFPIGVWMQDPLRERNSQINAINYKNIGVDIFIGLWLWPTDKYAGYNLLAAQALQDNNLTTYAGADTSAVDWINNNSEYNSTFLGYLLGDEPDMNKVSGDQNLAAASMPDAWQAAGDTLQAADTTREVYANFGKGFALYPWGGYHIDPGPTTADDFAKYVEPVDFLSSDYYGITDPYETLNSHGIWTYGRGVDNTILWANGKPVWGFVEGSAPFTQGTVPNNINGRMPPAYVMPAVWNMIVHGAQGIIYFCHDFSDGGMVEDGCLADAGMPEAINATNAMVQSYADILLSTDVSGTNTTTNDSVPVTTLTKLYGSDTYVFAMGDGNADHIYGQAVTATISVSGNYNRTVEVLSEGRNLSMINGNFTDSFDPYELHIYKILGEEVVINLTSTLNSPLDGTSTNNSSVVFNCSASIMNNDTLSNMTLYGSWNGGWHANETNVVTGTSNSTTFSKNLSEGSYVWNCLAYNNESEYAIANSNHSITVDLTSPQISIVTPVNNSNITVSYSPLNYVVSDNFNLDSCWYSYDTYLVNTTISGCSNISILSWSDGLHNLTVWANDTAGNLNSSEISFSVNTTDNSAPQFQFDNSTPANGSTLLSRFATINVSISESNLVTLKLNWNGTNRSIFDNETLLFMGFDNVSSISENQSYIVDLSDHNNNGFSFNSGGLSSTGHNKGGFNFRGTDYITISQNANQSITDYATWNFWVYTSDRDSCQSFMSKRVGWDVSNSWAMGIGFSTGNASEIGFEYSPDGTGAQKREINFNRSYIPLDQWSMITFVYNSSDTQQNVRLYIDGIEIPAIHINNSDAPLYVGTSDVEIGAINSGSPTCLFSGYMDEVSVFNKSLTLDEIHKLYTTTLYRNDSESWRMIVNQSKNISEGLDPGNYSYSIYAEDIYGNSNSTETRTLEIASDTVAPVVSLISPSNSYSWTSSSTVTFNYNVSDDWSVDNCSLIINGVIDQNDTNITKNTTQTFTKSLANGAYTWNVNCTDNSGNENSSSIYGLTVSYTAPTTTTPSGGGGGGGGAAPSTTTTTTEDNGTEVTSSMNKSIVRMIPLITRESGAVISDLQNMTVNSFTVNVNNETRNVMITLTRHYVKPSSITADNLSKVYAYLQLDYENLSENLSNITLKLEVEKSWLEEAVLEKEKISLFHFNEENNTWDEIETGYIEEDENYHYYIASVNSSSYFYLGESLTKEDLENKWVFDPWMENALNWISNVFSMFAKLNIGIKIMIIVASLSVVGGSIFFIIWHRMHSL